MSREPTIEPNVKRQRELELAIRKKEQLEQELAYWGVRPQERLERERLERELELTERKLKQILMAPSAFELAQRTVNEGEIQVQALRARARGRH
jgi:hypothetical protein